MAFTLWWLWTLQLLGFDPRGIFVFYDGRRMRRVDPLLTYIRLYDEPGFDPDAVILRVKNADGMERLRQLQNIDQHIRNVFQVKPLEEGGLTAVECVDLFADFMDYSLDLKKSGPSGPIWDPRTDSLPLGISPTPVASGSGSTATDNSSVAANPSVSESPGPS